MCRKRLRLELLGKSNDKEKTLKRRSMTEGKPEKFVRKTRGAGRERVSIILST